MKDLEYCYRVVEDVEDHLTVMVPAPTRYSPALTSCSPALTSCRLYSGVTTHEHVMIKKISMDCRSKNYRVKGADYALETIHNRREAILGEIITREVRCTFYLSPHRSLYKM